MIPPIGAAGKPLAVEMPCGAVYYKRRAEYRGRIDSPQRHGARKREVYCVNRKATTSIAIKPTINNNEIVATIPFGLGLSFRDRRP